MNDRRCLDCKTEYQHQLNNAAVSCPNCGSTYWALVSLREVQSTTSDGIQIGDFRREFSVRIPEENEQETKQVAEALDIEKLIVAQNKKTMDLIIAQNKTTHAVRSLAITFVAAPVITFAVLIVIALSVSTGNITFIILTAVSAIIICVYVLISALTELGKSRVD